MVVAQPAPDIPHSNKSINTDALKKFSVDITELARNGKLDPVIGREEEIRRSIQVLSRRTKNNPVLIGEPGVGKTAIIEGLALRIVNDDVPDSLKLKKDKKLNRSEDVVGPCKNLGLPQSISSLRENLEFRRKSWVLAKISRPGENLVTLDRFTLSFSRCFVENQKTIFWRRK